MISFFKIFYLLSGNLCQNAASAVTTTVAPVTGVVITLCFPGICRNGKKYQKYSDNKNGYF
jgi:hypothetical protein